MKLYEVTAPPSKWTGYDVVKDILGPANVSADSENLKVGQYLVCRPWSGINDAGMFSNMDCEPGEGGALGLPNPFGTDPRSIAVAAHEAYHAWLHMHGRVHNDEKTVNMYAEKWLRSHLSGMFLHQALEHLLKSKIHYGHN